MTVVRSGLRASLAAFGRAIERNPEAAVVRSLKFGQGGGAGGRVLVRVRSGLQFIDPDAVVDALRPPASVVPFSKSLLPTTVALHVAVDHGGSAPSLRLYFENPNGYDQDWLAGAGPTIVGLKWAVGVARQPRLITLYRPYRRGDGGDVLADSIDAAVASLVRGATDPLVVWDLSTARRSRDVALGDPSLTVQERLPQLLAAAGAVGADSAATARLLEEESNAAVGRIAYGLDAEGQPFLTVYVQRPQETVASFLAAERGDGGVT